MLLINLDEAKPGMVLVKPVYTLQDVLLLKSGVQLSEKNIHVLRSWGIQEIWVEGVSDESRSERVKQENELRDSIDKALRLKFSESLPDPVMEEIMRIAGNLLERRFLEKEKNHGFKKP